MEGTRVLALGYKPMQQEGAEAEADRGHVERSLAFAGLAAFRTQIRADSPRVIKQLIDAGTCVRLVCLDVDCVWWEGG